MTGRNRAAQLEIVKQMSRQESRSSAGPDHVTEHAMKMAVRFVTRYDGEVSEPLVGRQGSRVSMRVARASAALLSSHGRGIWPRDVLKEVSRGLSWLRQETLGSLDLCRWLLQP